MGKKISAEEQRKLQRVKNEEMSSIKHSFNSILGSIDNLKTYTLIS